MINGKHEAGFINRAYGFQMNFDNGYGLSIAWGPMHYCNNPEREVPMKPLTTDMFINSLPAESSTCEVACYDLETEKIINLREEDQVLGWTSVNDLVKLINEVSNWPTKVLT